YLGRPEVQGGQRPGGGAELAHQGGGTHVVAGHVPDDQGTAPRAEGDDVEPVTADFRCRFRGDVAVGELEAGNVGDLAGQQAVLEGERGGSFPGIQPRVVDRYRRPGY